jgi:hypothetical protein
MNNKLSQLTQIGKAIPVLNQEAANRAQAARQIQAQSAMTQTPQGMNARRAAQTIAAQNIGAAADINQQAAQSTQQQVAQVAQQGTQIVQEQSQEKVATAQNLQRNELSQAANQQNLALSREQNALQEQLSQEELNANQRLHQLGMEQDKTLLQVSINLQEELAKLGSDVKHQILDSRLQFERDENGRKFSNERQYADYDLLNAKTELAFDSKMRAWQQEETKAIMVLRKAGDELRAAAQRGWLVEEQRLDYEQQKHLMTRAHHMQEEINRREASANNRMMRYKGIGGVIGGIIAAIPAIAAAVPTGGASLAAIPAGVQMGQAVGSTVAGTTAPTQR